MITSFLFISMVRASYAQTAPTRPVPSGDPRLKLGPMAAVEEAPKAPFDVAAPPKDAEKTKSGLASKVLKKGTGKEHPEAADTVEVNYSGWMTNGVLFDSSIPKKHPVRIPLNRVIPGWTEGVQLMVVGEKRRLWIPGNLAYGDTAKRPGAPFGMLVFDVELSGITKAPKPIPAPSDVAAPPKGVTTTASGISYKVLQKGTGKEHPKAQSVVEVHYTGWTTDGKMFDSSVVRGIPAEFPLGGVIPGWTEGVQLMVVGEKTRFWIPGKLAYGDKPNRPGAPSGMLVFDIELIKIK